MKLQVEQTYLLTKEDVTNAIRHWMNSVHGVRISQAVDVTPVMREEQIPGIDPHDCEYIDVFDGVRVVVKSS